MMRTFAPMSVNQILSLVSMVVAIIEADSVGAARTMLVERGYSHKSANRVIEMAPVIDGMFGEDQ